MDDLAGMRAAVRAAAAVRTSTSPNPWVGACIEPGGFTGATQPPGGAHAEVMAIRAAGDAARGATLFTTLEPCCHTGRTGPCTEAIVAAGIARVVVGVDDPDPHVAGRGVAALRAAGVEVVVGVGAAEVEAQLRPYLHHRRTGTPWVILKLAASVDGRTAAPDGSSRWITGHEARADAHRLRAESDAVVVGAGTVRADDPALTVRHVVGRDPRRVVIGRAPGDARVHPCLEWTESLPELVRHLGAEGCLQVLVEGGAVTAAAFLREGLVDQRVVYLAPALFGGDDARPLLVGAGAATIDDVWRGRFAAVTPLGDDLRLDLEGAT